MTDDMKLSAYNLAASRLHRNSRCHSAKWIKAARKAVRTCTIWFCMYRMILSQVCWWYTRYFVTLIYTSRLCYISVSNIRFPGGHFNIETEKKTLPLTTFYVMFSNIVSFIQNAHDYSNNTLQRKSQLLGNVDHKSDNVMKKQHSDQNCGEV